MIASGSHLIIMAETATISGLVRCTGAACSSLVSVNQTLEVGGSLGCTNGKCTLSVRSGGDMTATGTISCSGNNQCLVDVASGSAARIGGAMTGSDIRLVIAGSLHLLGAISTTGQGYGEVAGSGKGRKPGYSGSANSYDRVAGSGAGHGGDGADGCYRSSYGTLPSGTIGLYIKHVGAYGLGGESG